MAKKSFIKKNEAAFSKMLMVLFLIILFSLAIPEIGTTANSYSWWVSTVDFFTSIRDHVSSFWMFYTLGGAVLFASIRNSK